MKNFAILKYKYTIPGYRSELVTPEFYLLSQFMFPLLRMSRGRYSYPSN